jgi:hypothetical protein
VDESAALLQHGELANTTKGVQDKFLLTLQQVQGVWNTVGCHPSNGTLIYRQGPVETDDPENNNLQLFLYYHPNENKTYDGWYIASDLCMFDVRGSGPLAKVERRKQNVVTVYGFAAGAPTEDHSVPPGDHWHFPSNCKSVCTCIVRVYYKSYNTFAKVIK